MGVREQVLHDIEALGDDDLRKLARYLELLRSRALGSGLADDTAKLAGLYAEFAAEDRLLAEQGMTEFAEQLKGEDAL